MSLDNAFQPRRMDVDELMQAHSVRDYQAAAMSQRNTIGGVSAPGAVSAPADFSSLLQRLSGVIKEAREAAGHAGSIASTIHGNVTGESATECARDQRVGLIGQYEDAIGQLAEALSDTRANLRRISNGISDGPRCTFG